MQLSTLGILTFCTLIPPGFGEGEGRQDVLYDPTPPGASDCQDDRVRKRKWPHDDLPKQVTKTETSNHSNTAQWS